MAAGGGLGSGGGNPVWSFLWFLGLFFIGYPVAGFSAGWYILILPFAVCIDGLNVSLSCRGEQGGTWNTPGQRFGQILAQNVPAGRILLATIELADSLT